MPPQTLSTSIQIRYSIEKQVIMLEFTNSQFPNAHVLLTPEQAQTLVNSITAGLEAIKSVGVN